MIRVSQRQMYSNFLFNMNNSLSAYMESHLQSATQKKVNRPSDDPYGTAQIMASNTQLYAIKQYNDNLSMAKGWLMQAESTMDQVQTGMSRIIEILEQASTGTLSSTQREILGNELRTIMEQMISYANVKFNGRYIFGGQKTDASPYSLIMGATSRDPGLEQARFVVEGQVSQSAIIRFMDDGDSGPPPVLPAFQYTLDKGATWIDSTPADWSGSGAVGDVLNPYGDPYKIRLGVSGVSVTLLGPDAATPFDLSWISASDPNDVHENGSWIYVHPAAQYNGDTNSPTVVQSYPYIVSSSVPPPPLVPAEAQGVFKRDIAVRIDAINGNDLTYSYSMDDGVSWVEGRHATIPAGGVSPADPIRIGVEGGFLNLGAIPTAPIPADTGAGTPYVPGDQFIIRPNRADIDLNIGAQSSLTVNNVGLDVFGGIYSQPYSYEGPTPSPADMSKNLFELIGKAIAFVETNSQTGSQEILALCQSVNSHLGLVRTTIGARMNRAETIAYQLESLRINETDRLSDLEDVDLGELMTRLAQQELAYRSVLQSSSIIMQLSLMNYI